MPIRILFACGGTAGHINWRWLWRGWKKASQCPNSLPEIP